MIQLAVFDMVGTTVQSGDQMPSAFREAFLSVGIELSDEAITNIRGLGWDTLGLTGLICGDDVVRGRPAPDLIHAAMSLAEVSDPKAVLVVGGTTSDLEAADAAGVGWSVAVLTGAHSRERLQDRPHSAILENVGALPAWLAGDGAHQYPIPLPMGYVSLTRTGSFPDGSSSPVRARMKESK